MDNHFFIDEPNLYTLEYVELSGQEAKHASKVLRKSVGDLLILVNGEGCKATAEIQSIQKSSLSLRIQSRELREQPEGKKVLGLGIIKVRDRFEFAIEKAVELGATTICLFESDHSERTRIKEDRLEAIIQSAFKQSGRWWKPELIIKNDLKSVLFEFADHEVLMAHEKKQVEPPISSQKKEKLLLVGPEGGFSEKEVELVARAGGELISLGVNRLRAETAVAALLSQFLFD
ncbi:MAG: 16S rRNA (uracil(1498)-N(3))-methyltransferase [Cyanothece sp. SIO1E1]|nr:16S rRNA (uracil(1498)-N(3))-methyltransferase [Cyanothece sp. SIO1E1]